MREILSIILPILAIGIINLTFIYVIKKINFKIKQMNDDKQYHHLLNGLTYGILVGLLIGSILSLAIHTIWLVPFCELISLLIGATIGYYYNSLHA
ncbi:MAG: hypothetical protein K2G70_03775 [Turicibacter sp.]|nr:hypothetical protein [Turicibacter sp.]